jgi:hypothetical protein
VFCALGFRKTNPLPVSPPWWSTSIPLR